MSMGLFLPPSYRGEVSTVRYNSERGQYLLSIGVCERAIDGSMNPTNASARTFLSSISGSNHTTYFRSRFLVWRDRRRINGKCSRVRDRTDPAYAVREVECAKLVRVPI